jgi:hypothetical protein
MSQLKYCQGPKCHTHDTKDRKKGPKDNKRNETRRRSRMYYLGGNACDTRCEREWFEVYGSRALDHFGRITEAKVLTKDNAWRKLYDWRVRDNGSHQHYVYNYLTDERRNITEQQYDNENTITPNGQLNI